MLFVGDFYQHTFDTSRDGATNSTLFNSKAKYESRFTAKGFICDNTSLVNSWRCSKNVCQFYTTSEVYTKFGMVTSSRFGLLLVFACCTYRREEWTMPQNYTACNTYSSVCGFGSNEQTTTACVTMISPASSFRRLLCQRMNVL